jgi:hypothetical protein
VNRWSRKQESKQQRFNQLAGSDGVAGPARLFSLRHEFSSKWSQFISPPPNMQGDQKLTMPLTEQRLPFLFQAFKRKHHIQLHCVMVASNFS